MNLGVFRSAKYAFVDYFGILRHDDAQEKILSQILVFSSVLYVTGGFSIYRVRSWDYFGVSRHVDAQEKILSQILDCRLVLNVTEGFSTNWVCFCGLFRCASTRFCLGDDFVANHSFQLGFECTWGFWPAKYVIGTISVCLDMLMLKRRFCRKSYFAPRFWLYLGGFRPADNVSGDYFFVPRQADA